MDDSAVRGRGGGGGAKTAFSLLRLLRSWGRRRGKANGIRLMQFCYWCSSATYDLVLLIMLRKGQFVRVFDVCAGALEDA